MVKIVYHKFKINAELPTAPSYLDPSVTLQMSFSFLGKMVRAGHVKHYHWLTKLPLKACPMGVANKVVDVILRTSSGSKIPDNMFFRHQVFVFCLKVDCTWHIHVLGTKT